MTNHEFREIRQRLGLTQADLAAVFGYGKPLTISTYERQTNPRPIPQHVAMLMDAFAGGYRPASWPKGK